MQAVRNLPTRRFRRRAGPKTQRGDHAAQALLKSSVCALREGEAVGLGLGVACGVAAGAGLAARVSMFSDLVMVFWTVLWIRP